VLDHPSALAIDHSRGTILEFPRAPIHIHIHTCKRPYLTPTFPPMSTNELPLTSHTHNPQSTIDNSHLPNLSNPAYQHHAIHIRPQPHQQNHHRHHLPTGSICHLLPHPPIPRIRPEQKLTSPSTALVLPRRRASYSYIINVLHH
jgi:hypothetical protein